MTFNARVAHAAGLGIEAAVIGGFALAAALKGRHVTMLMLVVSPLVWRVLYAAALTALSRRLFHTPEATPVLSRPWLRLVLSGGVAIWRNQVDMAFPPRLPEMPTRGTAPIVALLPGYSCNAGCFGTLPQRLAGHGLECVAFEAGDPIGDLEANAAKAARWLNDVSRSAPDRPITVVGVSMGGIVARLATLHPDAPVIAHLVTISSPHHGTWMSRFGVGHAARQSSLDSAVLQTLRSQPHRCPATAIWTPDDAIIVPPESGKLAGANSIAVAGYSHLAIVEAPAVEAAIVEAVFHGTEISSGRYSKCMVS